VQRGPHLRCPKSGRAIDRGLVPRAGQAIATRYHQRPDRHIGNEGEASPPRTCRISRGAGQTRSDRWTAKTRVVDNATHKDLHVAPSDDCCRLRAARYSDSRRRAQAQCQPDGARHSGAACMPSSRHAQTWLAIRGHVVAPRVPLSEREERRWLFLLFGFCMRVHRRVTS